MPYSIMSSAELMEATRTLIPEEFFLSQRYFGVQRFTTADEIVFDEMVGLNTIAPFVSPLVDGKPIVQGGYNAVKFKPAYIKIEDVVRPTDTTFRAFAEPLNQLDNQLTRLNNGRVNALDKHVMAVRRTKEWMCAQYLLNGKYTVQGEAYPAQLLDFGANPLNRFSLAGPALWSAATSTPLQDIDNWANIMLDIAGCAPTEILMTSGVWSNLSRNQDFNDQYKKFQAIGGPLPNITPQAASKVQRKGQLGDYELIAYNDTYHDAAGTLTKYLPAGYVFMICNAEGGLDGRQLHAGIQNNKAILAGLNKGEMFQSEWANASGSANVIGTESAPLVAARKVNAVIAVKVL